MLVFIVLLIYFSWSDLRMEDHIEACLLAGILWEVALARWTGRRNEALLNKIYMRLLVIR